MLKALNDLDFICEILWWYIATLTAVGATLKYRPKEVFVSENQRSSRYNMRIVETEYFDKGQHQKKPNTLTRSEDRNQMDDLSKHTSSVTMTIKLQFTL